MWIGDREFTRGSTPGFKDYYAAHKKKQLDDTEIQAVFGTDAKGFNLLFNVLASGTGEFADLDAFIREMNILRRDWGGQKLFYEKPDKDRPNTLSGVEGEEGDQIKLYSARRADKVQNLLWWAFQNNIPVEGLEGETEFHLLQPRQAAVDAPFKGHFGDRSHTIKHLGQKQGSRLISIVLTQAGSAALRERKKDPGNIDKGGEGYQKGDFGLKSEADFVSVALGGNKETWNYLKGKIEKIVLHPSDGTEVGGTRSQAMDKKRKGGAPERIEGVGRIVDVTGRGMNCLIRAIFRALNIDVDDHQVGEIRWYLQEQGVAGEANPLNLTGRPGGVLLSYLVQQGVINANRGLEVYTSAQQPPHVVVGGVNPIRLWFSAGHFQAIVP